MAIAVNVANLGSTAADPSSTTVAFTTGSAVASGAFIVVSVGWYDSAATLSTVSGGSLTWTIDAATSGSPPNDQVALVTAQAPSGLASGTTITATFSAAVFARHIAGSSFTGVATSTPVDVTTTGNRVSSATTAWTSNSATITAGSLLIATAFGEINGSSTPTSPSIEALDWVDASGPSNQTTCYRIESTGGSYTVAGTFSGATSSSTIAVAYLAAAGGGGATPIPDIVMAPPIPS